MKQLRDYLILKERQQLGLNRVLLVIALLLYVFSTEIANYGTTVNEAWVLWKNILMFDLTLVVFSLRNEVKKLITNFNYKAVFYLLLNYFIDQYFGLQGWSWNDFITVMIIIIEYKFKKNEDINTTR